MAHPLMIQGTASNAGKSIVVAGLCRIFHQDGFSVAPFKSQNMALNSFITADGLEMGRAQAVQAEAAGLEPDVRMNPILLKPTGDAQSQIIVNGEVAGVMRAMDYYAGKTQFLPAVRAAYAELASRHDIIVIEGAGSPAEINLRDNDFVNMGMAAIADAPVLLVGDIDRGGVFASLYGTVMLLPEEERRRIKGFIINKFRGDSDILRPGLRQLEELTGIPVLGVVPYLALDIDDEDSLSDRFRSRRAGKSLDAVVLRPPRLANFTDFAPLERHPVFGLRYVQAVRDLGSPDLVILPGSKNTMADLAWLRQNGLEAAVKKLAAAGVPVIGVCGGYQMLGTRLDDPEGHEHGGLMRGMELLPARTRFAAGKVRTRVTGRVGRLDGVFACLEGAAFHGYEIHMGRTQLSPAAAPFATLVTDGVEKPDGAAGGNVFGTYVHGVFDSGEIADRLAAELLARKGLPADFQPSGDHGAYKEEQYNMLAAALRDALDMEAIQGVCLK